MVCSSDLVFDATCPSFHTDLNFLITINNLAKFHELLIKNVPSNV